MVKNGTFVIDEKDSKIKINRGVSIKICDFGLASRFKPGHYKCDKMPPQFALNYASPQMFNDVTYDARKVHIIIRTYNYLLSVFFVYFVKIII